MTAVRSALYVATAKGVLRNDGRQSSWAKVGSLSRNVTAIAVAELAPRRLHAGTAAGVFTAAEGVSGWAPANEGMNVARVVGLAAMTGGVAYAMTAGGQLFATANAGESWRIALQVDAAHESQLHVATDGRRSVYVGSEAGIHAQSEPGAPWERVTVEIPGELAATQSTPATLYAAFKERLSKSMDGGRTWTVSATGLADLDYWWYYGFYASALEVDGDDPSVVYAGYSDLYKTVDAGQTWRAVYVGLRYGHLPAVAARGPIVHVTLHNGVQTSTDGGRSWSALRLGGEQVQSLVIDPVDPARSYAGTASGRVYRTDDYGNNWYVFGEGLPGAAVRRLAINDSGAVIYAATEGGVFDYRIGPPAFERLPDDPDRLPALIRQLLDGIKSGVVTDVTLANSRPADQPVIVAWLPQGNASGAAVPTFRLTLPAYSDDGGGTLTIADVAAPLGLEGLGAMVVIGVGEGGELDAAAELGASARVRSAAACGAGSVSQSLPGVESRFGAQRARALGLHHDGGYRTNVGIVNLADAAREFTVVVTGQRQSQHFAVSVPPFSMTQTGVPDGNYGAASVTVIGEDESGLWAAYGSSVDNASRDAWASIASPLRAR